MSVVQKQNVNFILYMYTVYTYNKYNKYTCNKLHVYEHSLLLQIIVNEETAQYNTIY